MELSILVPVFLLILLGILEFGFLFDHTLTLQYATREGARVGSALSNGGGPLGCGSGQSPNAATVDPLIIAAVHRVLDSPGSRVAVSRVPTISITTIAYNSSGTQVGSGVNVWTYSAGATSPVDGAVIDYTQTTVGWAACNRSNATPYANSISVSLTYTYQFVTPLGGILRFFGGSGWSSIPVSDRTTMSLNPTNQ